ncbi:MAG TPA: DNA polymerase III subunit delta [Candidatus Acidoferrales bacterium]|nr:DNA polymerase III subunit delta [Candidatus Acidoferrales bacterium]
MTPAQLLAAVKKGSPPPVILLLGPEAYQRRRIKEALLAAFPPDAIAQHDLAEVSLVGVIDDARALSLFASERLIWVLNAEAALPKGRAAEEDGDSESAAPSAGDAASLAEYVRDATPGVTLVFEAIRFDFEGDDKRRQDRVRKFYAAIGAVIELHRYSAVDARAEAEVLARQAGFRIEAEALDLLVEALGADIARIAVEIEKLALFAGNRTVSTDDITALVPDARAATIFALVSALGRRDRARSLAILDTLTREGEYLPLALAFLSTQFRIALAAREAGLKSAQQIQGHFTRMGVPMWSARADQVWQTASKFSRPQIERALGLIYQADKSLRDARPDDRTVMERFILEVVG